MLRWLALALVACRGGGEAPRSPVAVESADLPGLVHGANIAHLALVDDGTAALSVDELGDVRLWPALDGKHPPVAVAGSAVQGALARRPDGWLAATIDDAGGLELHRLARGGAERGRARAPGELAYREVVAFDDRMLARREDDRLVALADDGRALGVLAVHHGESIAGLAARRGGVVAAIASAGQVWAVRWVERDPLRWGATVPLGERVELPIALAPGHRRLAAVAADRRHVRVFDVVGSSAQLVPDDDDWAARPDVDDLGFVTDDRLALIGPQLWWIAKPARAHVTGASFPSMEVAAIADNLVAGNHGPSLALATPRDETRYLGYRDVPNLLGRIGGGDGGVTIDMFDDGRSIWLDGELREVRSFDFAAINGYAVDDRYVVRAIGRDAGNAYELVDLSGKRKAVPIGSVDQVSTARFDHARRELLVSHDPKRIARWRIDADGHVEALPELTASADVVLFDPARAGGIAAMDHEDRQTSVQLSFFTTGATPASQIAVDATRVLAYDLAGTVYLADVVHVGQVIVVERGKHTRDFDASAAGPELAAGAASHDGATVVVFGGRYVIAFDRGGVERWRTPMWHVDELVYTRDDRAIVAVTRSGLVKLDAATGAPLATACAWKFGLYDQPAGGASFGERPICR